MIVPTQSTHLPLIAAAVSQAGTQELAEVYGMTVHESLRRNVAASLESWTMFSQGDALCLFGIAPVSVMHKQGEFWIVSTTHIARHRFAFARLCKTFLPLLLSSWEEVSCVLEHQRSDVLRWALWLGAKVTPIDQRLSLMRLENR